MLQFKGNSHSIKAVVWVLFIILSVRLISYCEEEKAHARSYPQVRTSPVTNITANGATFNGNIYSLGTEPVIEHGFVWGTGQDPTLASSKVLLGPSSSEGSFSSDIVTSLTRDEEYTVKAFVQSAEHVVYGVGVKFVSLGSGAPVVTSLRPDSAAWLDTIRISGRNFSLETNRNVVKLNQIQCKIISGTDTTLFVEVSTGITQIKNLVSVEISGNRSELTKDTFRLIPPVIKQFLPAKAYWGDTVKIRGSHFRTFNADIGNSIKLGAIACERVGELTDSTISFKISNETATLNSDLILKINGISITAKKQFELLPPYFTISPKNGTWGSTLTLTGRFNSTVSKNHLSFYGGNIGYIVQPEDLLSTSLKSISIKVPIYFSLPASVITYEAASFSVTSADTFHLNAPVITSFSPLSGPSGIKLTIKGKYFHPLSSIVRFAGIEAVISSLSDSVIIVTVPDIPWADKVKIGVTSIDQSTVSTEEFQYLNPKITSISPLTGTFNDEIAINGENFISPSVSVGGAPANIVSSSPTKIVVQVPVTIDSVPRAFTVTSGLASTVSADMFTLSPPQVSSVSPSGSVVPGQEITITGNNLNPEASFNSVLWDIYPLIIKSATKTQIVATLPMALPRGNNVIKLITGGYTRFSAQSFTVSSKWIRIPAPYIPSTYFEYWGGNIAYGQSIKNFGYVCSEMAASTYRFNPADNSWTQLGFLTPFDGYYHYIMMGQVVHKDSLYLIGGQYTHGMKMFYDGIERWKDLPSPGQKAGVAFSLNDKIYFGLDYSNPSSQDFYECDPANNYLWVRKGDFPNLQAARFSAYFTIGDKGYVVFTDNSVWQFNPDNFTWQRVGTFPGSVREFAFSFVMGNQAYVGGGKSTSFPGTEYNDIWQFDPNSNTWTQVAFVPGVRHSAVAFSIGSKAYIGFGLKYQYGSESNLWDFYEYDPNFSEK